MFETYIQQIRSITEIVCQVCNGAITQVEVSCLEIVQKTALAIMRGVKHTKYEDALKQIKSSQEEKPCALNLPLGPIETQSSQNGSHQMKVP